MADSREIVVTQADRESAAEFVFTRDYSLPEGSFRWREMGEGLPIVQAFARHRIQSTTTERARAEKAEAERDEAVRLLMKAEYAADEILAPLTASIGRYFYDWADCPDMIEMAHDEGVVISAKAFRDLYDATDFKDFLTNLEGTRDA